MIELRAAFAEPGPELIFKLERSGRRSDLQRLSDATTAGMNSVLAFGAGSCLRQCGLGLSIGGRDVGLRDLRVCAWVRNIRK